MDSLFRETRVYSSSSPTVRFRSTSPLDSRVVVDAKGCSIHHDANGIRELKLELRRIHDSEKVKTLREMTHEAMQGCYHVKSMLRSQDAWQWEPSAVYAYLSGYGKQRVLLSRSTLAELESRGVSIESERRTIIEGPANVLYLVKEGSAPLAKTALGLLYCYSEYQFSRERDYGIVADPYRLVNKVVFPSLPETSQLVPSTYQRCEDCKGTGKYVGLFEVSPCRSCGGRGEM